RWLGLAGVIAVVALVGGAAWYLAMPTELEHARLMYLDKFFDIEDIGVGTNREFVVPFDEELRHSGKVPVTKMEQTFAALDDAKMKLAALEKEVEAHKYYQDARINSALDAVADYAKKWQLYMQNVKALVDAKGALVPGKVARLNAVSASLKQLQDQIADSV